MKFFVTLFVLLISPLASAAGSWTSGGGGTGLACFSTDEAGAAVRAGADLSSRPDLVAELSSVLMTDIAENANNAFVAPLAGETPRAYLDRIMNDRLQFAPSFFTVLRSALARVQVATVKTSKSLPASNDTGGLNQWITDPQTGVRRSVPLTVGGKCALVQVALRTQVGGKGAKATVRVSVNDILYAHLGDGREESRISNQAALQLHEAIYLVGTSLGQTTSLDARRLTAMLLSNDRIQAFHEIETEMEVLNPAVQKPEAVMMEHELSEDGFAAAPLPAASRAKDPIAQAIISYQAAQQQLAQDTAQADDETKRTLLTAFYDARNGPEAFVAAALIALSEGAITDFSAIGNPASPLHARTLKAVCHAAATAQVGAANPDDVEKAEAANRLFARAVVYCAKAKLR